MRELADNGVKFMPDAIVRIERMPDGKFVFLESGNARAGLQHIVARHVSQFADRGIAENQIPDVIFEALQHGKIIGSRRDGMIYEVMFDGKIQHLIVGSDSGFVVSAHPVSP